MQTGLATCQIGKAIGLRVVGTAGTPEGLELVRREGGADAVYNHRDADYVQRIQVCLSWTYSNYTGWCSSVLNCAHLQQYVVHSYTLSVLTPDMIGP